MTAYLSRKVHKWVKFLRDQLYHMAKKNSYYELTREKKIKRDSYAGRIKKISEEIHILVFRRIKTRYYPQS